MASLPPRWAVTPPAAPTTTTKKKPTTPRCPTRPPPTRRTRARASSSSRAPLATPGSGGAARTAPAMPVADARQLVSSPRSRPVSIPEASRSSPASPALCVHYAGLPVVTCIACTCLGSSSSTGPADPLVAFPPAVDPCRPTGVAGELGPSCSRCPMSANAGAKTLI